MLILVEAQHADGGRLADAARGLGHQVHVLPPEGKHEGPRIPGLQRGDFRWGLFFGEAPSAERYRALHDEARALNVTLLNDPTQHHVAEDLSRTVAALGTLTAKTAVVERAEQLDTALGLIAPPVFVRGALTSAKAQGWSACVAKDAGGAKALVSTLLADGRGPALVREMLPLRRLERVQQGFPVAREYRLFVLDADVLALGSYWEEQDPFGRLTERDEQEIRTLAHEVAKRVKVPWLAVDVGQLESGEWRVIETGDPCSAALGSVQPRVLLSAVAAGLEARAGC